MFVLLFHFSASSGFRGRYISSLENHEQASASIVSIETPSGPRYNYTLWLSMGVMNTCI